MNKKTYFGIIFWLVTHICLASDTLFVQVLPKFGDTVLQLESTYTTPSGDTIVMSALRLYVSGFQLDYADGSHFAEAQSYHLIDVELPKTLRFALPNAPQKAVMGLHFNLGVDSLMSVSGAIGGDLDPTNGMYWAWQSGYINLKIEGQSPSCPTPKHEFRFHLGGYAAPNAAIRPINLLLNEAQSGQITLEFDVSRLFEQIDLNNINSVMIPGAQAMRLADEAAKTFTTQ